MASFYAIHSVADSLASYLRYAYQADQAKPEHSALLPSCDFAVMSSGEMGDVGEGEDAPVKPRVSLYMYRATVNEHLRNQPLGARPSDAPPPLALDLHFLLTVWSDKVEDELRIMGWTMLKLHTHQILGASDLTEEGKFGPDEVIHVIPAELSNEDLMRIWDAIRRPYCLSASYIARVVRLEDLGTYDPAKPVLARRFEVQGKGGGS